LIEHQDGEIVKLMKPGANKMASLMEKEKENEHL
jgi:hypothetical protein